MITTFKSRWFEPFAVILQNAGSLVGTQAITSVLGFLYWWVAARCFPAEEVGFASASISAMLLLGTAAVMGFGTYLMGTVRTEPKAAGDLIATALSTVGIAGFLIGYVFLALIVRSSSELNRWSENAGLALLFPASVALTAAALVIDQALIGFLRGSLQFWRNGLFALAKLGILVVVGYGLNTVTGIAIYITWFSGILISILFLAGYAQFKGVRLAGYRPRLQLVRKVGIDALIHHALNLALQLPGFALPVLVTIVLSAQINAYFYVAWMIASFVFVVPVSLSTVLYAVGSVGTEQLVQKFRFTFKLSLLIGLLSCAGLMVAANAILWIFGSEYASEASWSLRILSLAVFPVIIKNLYVATYRIGKRIGAAARIVIFGGLLELLFAAAGGMRAGLVGLSAGWVLAVYVEGFIMSGAVYRMIRSGELP